MLRIPILPRGPIPWGRRDVRNTHSPDEFLDSRCENARRSLPGGNDEILTRRCFVVPGNSIRGNADNLNANYMRYLRATRTTMFNHWGTKGFPQLQYVQYFKVTRVGFDSYRKMPPSNWFNWLQYLFLLRWFSIRKIYLYFSFQPWTNCLDFGGTLKQGQSGAF